MRQFRAIKVPVYSITSNADDVIDHLLDMDISNDISHQKHLRYSFRFVAISHLSPL